MTNEEKDLLLKDLSARLPYGVKIMFSHNGFKWEHEQTLHEISKCDDGEYAINGWGIHGIKPYLRPISSMKKEEWKEFENEFEITLGAGENSTTFEVYDYLAIDFGYSYDMQLSEMNDMFSWLYSRHFDVNRLIPRHLALEAPEGMY